MARLIYPRHHRKPVVLLFPVFGIWALMPRELIIQSVVSTCLTPDRQLLLLFQCVFRMISI